MKVLFALIVFIPLVGLADEPPEWNDFVVHSENKKWTAVVQRQGNSELASQDDWQVSVYKGLVGKRSEPGIRPAWSRPYRSSGYSTGYLSNDGGAFSYVEPWYYPNKPVIQIYRSECTIQKHGSFFNVGNDLTRTASHQLWLQGSGDIRYLESQGDLYLQLETIKGSRKIAAVCEAETSAP
jgi:hypothetical protein